MRSKSRQSAICRRWAPCIMSVWAVAAALLAASWSATADSAGVRARRLQATPAAPCAVTWVGREQEFEEYIRTAPLDRMEDVPIGVTKPKRWFFRPGGPIRSVAWKQLRPGRQQGYWESYKAEIAAYELDKLLALHMVPPAAERRIDRERGAAIQWVEPVTAWDMEHPVSGPEPAWSKQVSRMKLFDQLIGNIDRNEGNLVYDGDWHLILIDHSRAFTDKKDIKRIAQPGRIDKWLWDKIEALTRDDLQRALGAWLIEAEIDAIVVRRDAMRAAVANLIAERGEGAVFLR